MLLDCRYFVFAKGAAKTLAADNWSNDKSKWVAAVLAACTFAITAVVVVPLIRLKTRRDLAVSEAIIRSSFIAVAHRE